MKIFGLCCHFGREEGWWSLYIHTEDEDLDWPFFRALTWNSDVERYTLSLKGHRRLISHLYWEW